MSMRAKIIGYSAAAAIVLAFVGAAASHAASPAAGPRYTADGKLEHPGDYRSWVYLTTGFDMSYVDTGGDPDMHMLDNVFVNREAYESFQKTGTWPDKTVMVLEARRAAQKGSINKRGHFQTGEIMGMEVHVKDVARFGKDGQGWAFFGFDGKGGPGQMIPQTASCQQCHQAHGAVDTTFVQFYPTLLPTAQRLKTLSAAYLKDEAASAR